VDTVRKVAAAGFLTAGSARGSRTCRAAGGGPVGFTPVQVAEVKALACTLARRKPVSRLSAGTRALILAT